jgi:beta-galactosidase
VTVTGDGFSVHISKASGAIDSWKVKGEEQLFSPLVPNFWRAPTDNDRGNRMAERHAVWRQAAEHARVGGVRIRREVDETAFVQVDQTYPDAADTAGTLTYTFTPVGDIRVTFKVEPKGKGLASLPRVGLTMQIPLAYDQVTWLGRGPHESYADRKDAAFFGKYTLNARDFYFPYVEPQECGNRTDTLWVTFTDRTGKGIRITGDPKINFGVLPYTAGELSARKHPWELNPCGNWIVTLDYGQMGLAGEDSWGALPWPEYQLLPDRAFSYGFVLSPAN